jgi:hypothetical protein
MRSLLRPRFWRALLIVSWPLSGNTAAQDAPTPLSICVTPTLLNDRSSLLRERVDLYEVAPRILIEFTQLSRTPVGLDGFTQSERRFCGEKNAWTASSRRSAEVFRDLTYRRPATTVSRLLESDSIAVSAVSRRQRAQPLSQLSEYSTIRERYPRDQ